MLIFFELSTCCNVNTEQVSLSQFEEKKFLYRNINYDFFIGNIFMFLFLLTKIFRDVHKYGTTIVLNLLTIGKI